MDPGPCGAPRGASRGAPRGASGGVPGGAPRGAPGGVPRGVPGGVLGGVPRGVPGGVPGGAVPGGLSGLESSLPHSDPPCLIVEDSQPDSTGIEDDPESSYRALLTRRLSALQPRAASPVLELISSPVGSRSSQSSSQSQPPICEMNPSFEESEVLEVSEKNRGRSDQMNSRAGSQSVGGKGLTPLPVAEGASQFGLLELSQSQDFGSEPDQNQTRTGESFESQSSRPGPQVCVQALLHSQVLDQDPDQDREEMMSSQQDLFDKPGPADATRLSSTPSHSLALLQLSGSVQGTLVHNSLSQASEDFVAPTPDPFSPALVPSSPTDLTPQGGVRPGPASSTPVSQNTPGFEPERPLSVPSQPDFSHDVFVATPRSSPPHHAPDEDEEATQIEPDLSTPSQNCPPEPGPESSPSAADQAEKLNVPGSQKSQEAKNQPETPKPRQEHDPRGQERDPRGLNNGKSATSFIQSDAKANSQPAGSVPESAAGSQTKVLNVDHEKTARTVTQGGAKSNSQPAGSSVRESNHEKISLSQNGAKANSQPAVTPLTLNVPQAKIKSAGHDKVSQGSDPSHPGRAAEGAELNAGAAEGAELNAGAAEGAELNAGAAETQREATLGLALSQNLTPEVTEAGGKMAGGRKEKREASGAKSLDSSGDMSFHFTLPKEGELIGPSVGATPPHLSQLKQSLRHSTPIEVNSLSQNSDVSAGSDITAEGSDVATEGADGKLSLRMKLVTPVEEGSSERFSLQRPSLADDASSRPTKSPHSASVFSRVRQVHRAAPEDSATLRSPLFASPQRNSLQNNSLPNSQSDASMQELTSSAANESRGKSLSQNAPGAANSLDKTDPETPPPRRAGPAHRRQVRTIQEVRTTVTRIITDVYYEDGKEVDRTVTQECDEPVVQFQVLDVSPSRTGSSSLTSGDLADISSSICTTGTTSSSTTGPSDRPAFLIPSTRGGKSGRRGGGARGGARGRHRSSGSVSPRGKARRGRPPSHSSSHRAPPAGSAQDPSSQVQVSDSAASSPDPQSSSSFVGLRVVAKWSSNGYFYSGRIIQDFGVQGGPASSGSGSSPGSGPGENRFRLRFDDGYECELWARDILLCDPIPLETEVTALNQDQTYCTGVVKAHKLEDLELQYCVERGEHRVWFPRSSVILSLDQGNRLRERHSLGPYQHCSVGTASDISLDNLVEGKRKRRGAQSGLNPSSRSPRGPRPKPSPGPSPGPNPGSKRKSSSERPPAAKRGRRGAVQQVSALNTSDSDPSPVSCDHAPGACDVSCDLVTTHGPLPQNTALFEGFVFLLTSSSERDRLSNRREDEDLVQTGPYSKRYTESQLQSGGGIILKEFNHQQCEAAYQSLLIADQHCCNGTYLLCVVSAVPCVSHLWVRDCCRENQLQNYRNYLLPAGAGPGGGVREWRGPRSFPFKSLRILICVKDRIQFWSELVQLGGGTALIQQDHTDLSSLSADVLVLGPGPDPVPGLHLPRVSVDWIIDSVVCGETLDFSGSWFGLDSSSSSS